MEYTQGRLGRVFVARLSDGESVYDAVEDTMESLPRKRRGDPDAVVEAVRRAVRAAVVQRWGKKPMCHVHVLTV